MLTSDQKRQLKAFHNNLSDHPLDPSDERYINVFDQSSDPIADLATSISFSEFPISPVY